MLGSIRNILRKMYTLMGGNDMSKRQLLLLSSSKVEGHEYLKYAEDDICTLLQRNQVKTILFVPYALHDHDEYTATVAKSFKEFGYNVEGIHKYSNPIDAVEHAQAIFVGGGNTFRLLKHLYELNLMDVIQKRTIGDGVPYIGSSAGTNVATTAINTTNDMPIVYPPSLRALQLVPFNINPHYLDPDSSSEHKGETRDERINQFHEIVDTPPVLGLREGSTLSVSGNVAVLRGIKGAKLFVQGQPAKELNVGDDVSFLLN